MDEFKLTKAVPLPKSQKYNKYPLGKMQVGESFAVPSDYVQGVRMAVSQYQKRNKGVRFTTRKADTGYRCWRVQ